MENPRTGQDDANEQPVTESEALKSAETINEEKKNKEPVSDEDFPGYPHYPANEDILNVSSGMDRVELDVENITRGGNVADSDLGVPPSIPPVNASVQPVIDDLEDEDDDIGIVPGTEADVTKEDLLILGPKDRDMDMGEDEEVMNRGYPLGLTGDELDIPDADVENQSDSLGQGDEENDYYSLGGDAKESLEEDPSGSF